MLALALLVLATAPVRLGTALYSDAPEPTLFVPTQGGTEAIDPRAGTARWSAPGSPLLLHGGLVLTRGGGVLDAATGRRLFAIAGVPDERPGPGRRAGEDGATVDGVDYVSSSFEQCYAGGARPRVMPPCTHGASAVRIDWDARKVVPVAAVPPEPAPAAYADAQGRLSRDASGAPRLRTKSGAQVDLFPEGAHGGASALVSGDGLHVVALAPLAVKRAGPPPYDVFVFDAATGRRLAQLTVAQRDVPQTFVVRGGLLLYYAPHVEGRPVGSLGAVGALDLASGQKRWERPALDLSQYFGPMPP